MTKEDQVAFHKWDATRAKTAHSNIQAWQAACAYKDKRIKKLRATIEEFIYIESHGEDILSEGDADD